MSFEKLRENLANISQRESMLSERRICELYDLAELAAEAWQEQASLGLGVYDIMALLTEELSGDEVHVHGAAMPGNVRALEQYERCSVPLDRAVFCEMLLSALSGRGITLSERDFLESEDTPERMAT